MAHSLPLFDLEGKLAVVTGASRGIGATLCVGLASAGADVVGVARTLPADGGMVASQVRDLGRKFTPIVADLSLREDTRELAQRLTNWPAPIDILINNAGIARFAPIADQNDDLWDEVIEINLAAPFVLAREVGTKMVSRKHGKIIFLASMLTFQGGSDVASYTASKSGVAGIVHAMANEWSEHGVQVNALAPGYVKTDLTHRLQADTVTEARLLSRIPAGRWSTPDDLIGPAIFLASSASDYVTGAILPVDGGWLTR